MRPKTKDDAKKLTLTLSAPAREILMSEALRRGVSRTQIVEDLVFELAAHFDKGKNSAQPHGADASVIHEPFDGGSKTPLKGLKAAMQARLSK